MEYPAGLVSKRSFPLLFMSMLKEFRDFAMKGNVVDLAVGVIIGGAFGKIVSSLVGDVLMPIIGVLLKGVDFTTLAITVGGASIKYGMFIQTVVDFIIVAFCIFLMIKAMMKLQKPKPVAPSAPAEPPADIKLLTEIRDLLRK